MLEYEALRTKPVDLEPFPHLVVTNFVPGPDLERVVKALPALNIGGSFPIGSLSLGGAAAELISELEGAEFRGIVAERLRINLDDMSTMVTLRGRSRAKDGRIHCDSAAKRITVLLYLNLPTDAWERQEGCLRLLAQSDDLEDFTVEVPPVNGTLLVFPNGPTAWHGHRAFVGPRYVVQLNYMTDNGAARAELRRHRMSAIVKRVLAA